MFVLQNEVRAAMPHPEQFVPDTLENITGYLRTGICIGAWQQGRLGAYLILRLCGQSSENYAAFLGVPQSQWQHWANADSAVVHPDWRGNGLQRAMLEAALPLLPPQITHLGATISPDNSYSLRKTICSGRLCLPRTARCSSLPVPAAARPPCWSTVSPTLSGSARRTALRKRPAR